MAGFHGKLRGFHGKSRLLPGLVNVYIAIEHGPVEIVDLPMKNHDFP